VKLIKPTAVIFIALVHAYVFGVVWAAVGSRAGFFVLGGTNSSLSSVVASTFATSLLATAPLAFAAGRIGGEPLLVYIGLSFVLAWSALNIWYVRAPLLSSKAVLVPLAVELMVIACFSYAFSSLGSRTRKHIAGA
jgi:hypothetical protein